MRRHLPILTALLLLAALVTQSPDRIRAQTPPTAGSYLETFDQYETSSPLHVAPPALERVPGLDILTHSRNSGSWAELEPMTGADAIQHGSACEPPPATHNSRTPLMGYEESAFICRDHLMTAIKAGGYGLIYLTPNQLVDFSQGEAVIKFDVSTFRSSTRDWIDVWITPYEDNLPAPLEPAWPDLSGVPKRALHIPLSSSNAWGATVYRNHVPTTLATKWWINYATLFTPSSIRRDTVELRLTTDRVHVCMPAYNHCWTYEPLGNAINPPLDWTRGVVQIGHHSYNPHKACTDVGKPAAQCPPNTWHWDNLSISPSVPFTIIRADQRFVMGNPMALTFPIAAPADSHLRVSAHGIGYEVSLDDGASWALLTSQPHSKVDHGAFKPYWHPIPAGTTAVLLRATQPNSLGPNAINYAALWSPNPLEPPPLPETPTPTPTEAPTNTPTTEPTPTNTATPVLPTATPTPLPICRTPYERSEDGGATWATLHQPMGCP